MIFVSHKQCHVCKKLGHKIDMIRQDLRGWFTGRWYRVWVHEQCLAKFDKIERVRIKEARRRQ